MLRHRRGDAARSHDTYSPLCRHFGEAVVTQSPDFGIIVRSPGGPEALEWSELSTTAPARGEVLIAQRAVGVNFIDTYYRQGHYPWPVTPLIPGGEAAGIVEGVGEGDEFQAGGRVAYILSIRGLRT